VTEVDLLVIIWSTVEDAVSLKISPEWPTRDYVRRTFARSHPEQADSTKWRGLQSMSSRWFARQP